MSFRDVLTTVIVDEAKDKASSYAISLASQFGAHLTGAVLAQDAIPLTLVSDLPRKLADDMQAEAERVWRAATDRFMQAAQAASVVAESVLLTGGPRRVARDFSQIARHFDLSIVGQVQDWTDAPDEEVLAAALFASGRPALVVPEIQTAPARFDHCMVAWDGSDVAARAVAGAMPILRAARHVQVVTVPGRTSGAVDFPGFNITRHFARHDVKCELKVAPTTMDVGNTLLSLAVDGSADLLVMGAYGHSRLRDLVLGGATQVVLQSMTLPVFMAH